MSTFSSGAYFHVHIFFFSNILSCPFFLQNRTIISIFLQIFLFMFTFPSGSYFHVHIFSSVALFHCLFPSESYVHIHIFLQHLTFISTFSWGSYFDVHFFFRIVPSCLLFLQDHTFMFFFPSVLYFNVPSYLLQNRTFISTFSSASHFYTHFFFRIVASCPLFFPSFPYFHLNPFLYYLNFIPICSSGSNFHAHFFFKIIL